MPRLFGGGVLVHINFALLMDDIRARDDLARFSEKAFAQHKDKSPVLQMYAEDDVNDMLGANFCQI